MRADSEVTVKYLKDYQSTPYDIKHVDLSFDLHEDYTEVTAQLKMSKRAGEPQDLILNGVDLELVSLKCDGKDLDDNEYHVEDDYLKITASLPDQFTLEVVNKIHPEKNTSLEGLYKSSGNFCTQCEAEGFRKITYFYDRPDVMATYTTTIEADKAKYPVILANGNCIDKKDLANGRHQAVWEDPFKKPSYLFALVAGDYGCLADSFKTKSGRHIKLEIYAAEQDIKKCHFAMQSLKNAMKWDEDIYGLECDLDHYMIVAIGDFNMGAMENKGLNIFNTSCVLADNETATDHDFEQVEGVIAHEYFHNWTGNRVTCRDWFQLCLKEGLTVFRDQEFSSSMGSASVNRIDNVRYLRSVQFPEDAGPMSHPVRPDRFVQINNFYTTTVYEKGSELVRMLKTYIGDQAFYKGMKIYFERHDGQAVTVEDFIDAMAAATNKDLEPILEWYKQSGTPEVHADVHYNEDAHVFTLHLRQINQPTADQKVKKPLAMPIVMGLVGPDGQDMELVCDDKENFDEKSSILFFSGKEKTFAFENLKEKPVPSLFRKFSAPVRLKINLSQHDLEFLMANDNDDFNRWDAGQELFSRAFVKMIKDHQHGHDLRMNEGLLKAVGAILDDEKIDQSFKAMALALPSDLTMSQLLEVVDVDALYATRQTMERAIATAYKNKLIDIYERLTPKGENRYSSKEAGRRSLRNRVMRYLNSLDDGDSRQLVEKQWKTSQNMTDVLASLTFMMEYNHPLKEEALNAFYEKWKNDALVTDQWFRLQAFSPAKDTLQRVKKLAQHKDFTLTNPNRVRSLLVAFCSNLIRFHDKSGEGYQFYADHVIALDGKNPQMAARLARVMSDWHRFDKDRQTLIEAQLKRIQGQAHLSSDVLEIIGQLLG